MIAFAGDPDDVTLAEARLWLRELLDEGARCPCCDQHAQRYRWSLPGSAARVLLRTYRRGGTSEFVESKTVKRPGEGGLPSIAAMWELLEQEPERRPDGGKSGWWRVTELGEQFIQGRIAIPKYAYVFDGVVEWRDGPGRTISDVLGEPFDWRRHMGRFD